MLGSNLLWVLLSTIALGMAAGTVGCLSYWKKQSLMSDALAHAALPGVVIAFLIIGEKNGPLLIVGAAISAVVAALFIQWTVRSSRIHEDTAMGIVLSSFFGLGMMLLAITNRTANGSQSGLDGFIFGQAASMVRTDVYTMGILAILVLLVIGLGFKEWKIYLFDAQFASGLGLSTGAMNTLYTALLVLTIVVGIQAVGVILIAALLIIPAVTARYWTSSFSRMLVLSAIFGGGSGGIGTFVSSLSTGWPTGPFIVLAASTLFLISLFFGKDKGLALQYFYYKKVRS